MKRSITLIILFCMVTLCFNTVYAIKTSRLHTPKFIRSALNTDSVCSDNILQFAESLLGTRYRSACSDPSRGFDCSGFVSYVFKSFNFIVPRSSYEFAAVGKRIRLEDAKPGDVILFTGTHKHSRRVGHIGIVYANNGEDFKFIHSTSGKEHCVTISSMDKTYKRRFVQVIRLLSQNDV